MNGLDRVPISSGSADIEARDDAITLAVWHRSGMDDSGRDSGYSAGQWSDAYAGQLKVCNL